MSQRGDTSEPMQVGQGTKQNIIEKGSCGSRWDGSEKYAFDSTTSSAKQ